MPLAPCPSPCLPVSSVPCQHSVPGSHSPSGLRLASAPSASALFTPATSSPECPLSPCSTATSSESPHLSFYLCRPAPCEGVPRPAATWKLSPAPPEAHPKPCASCAPAPHSWISQSTPLQSCPHYDSAYPLQPMHHDARTAEKTDQVCQWLPRTHLPTGYRSPTRPPFSPAFPLSTRSPLECLSPG